MMANNPAPSRRTWQLFECTLLLRKCLRTTEIQKNQLKQAIVENNFSEASALLQGVGRPQLNKLWAFSVDGCTVYVPPLCVAVCHGNVPLVQLLLERGANPNCLGRLHLQGPSPDLGTLANVTPLMMAVEDHPLEGLPFDPAVALALLEAGADINSTEGCVIKEEEEEGGSITYNVPDTLMHKSVDAFLPHSPAVFFFLLDHGANVFIRDTENGFTVLQKCLHGLMKRPEDHTLALYADELIRRGGFCCTFSYQHQTEFRLLLKSISKTVANSGDTSAIRQRIHLLLDAGYPCAEDDVAQFKRSGAGSIDQCLADKVYGLHVYSLKHLCRQMIRKSLDHWNCLDLLTDLPVFLIDYLKFR